MQIPYVWGADPWLPSTETNTFSIFLKKILLPTKRVCLIKRLNDWPKVAQPGRVSARTQIWDCLFPKPPHLLSGPYYSCTNLVSASEVTKGFVSIDFQRSNGLLKGKPEVSFSNSLWKQSKTVERSESGHFLRSRSKGVIWDDSHHVYEGSK